MAFSFIDSKSYLYTSESVTEGHPDKLCDQVSDSILDAIYKEDPLARVACETATTTNLVVIIGEITTTAKVDYEEIARKTIKDIGYNNPNTGIDWQTCEVVVKIHEQSPNINAAVSTALEHRNTNSIDNTEVDATGAGDQGMMVGFACNETPELMPMTMSLSHQLTQRLTYVRKNKIIPYLGPDGKSQVTIEYEFGKPKKVHTIIISTQHDENTSIETISSDITKHVITPVIPDNLFDKSTRVLINPSGKFVIGGPHGDAGLTGRKILVDTYGGVARHGGGAFSGKDPTKVDRSAAYAARYVAKNIVAAKIADRCEVQVSYAIGVSSPISISVETFGTGHIPDDNIVQLVDKHFDLRPGAIIRDLNLREPIYQKTAAYGHFGRLDIEFPWERTDKSEILKQEAF
jgi:S-adenosylmethionine synthetase